jgi:hypothetical protein
MQNNFKYIPLLLVLEGSAAAEIEVVCKVTRQRLKWNDAVRAGWIAVANEQAFSTYLSPEGVKALELEEEANKLVAQNS